MSSLIRSATRNHPVIDGYDVAGVQPPVRVDGGGGGVRIVAVAAHHARGADEQFTGLAEPDVRTGVGVDDPALDSRQRGSDATRPVLAVVGRDVGGTAQLGHAVALPDPAADPPRAGPGHAILLHRPQERFDFEALQEDHRRALQQGCVSVSCSP
jgi:hypothetical protein